MLGRDSFTLLAENGQFPLEQSGPPGESIPSCDHTQDGRGMRSQTRSCEDVSLSNGDRDGIDELQH